jgi:hypothetical protein
MYTMTDQEFLDAFEASRIPASEFHHRDHLRLALVYLQRYGAGAAASRIAESIRRYAAHLGKAHKYNETVTQAWLQIVHAAAAGDIPGATLDQLVASHPELLDKNVLERYYSRDLLDSAAARFTFVRPDLRPLPAAASVEC